MINRQCLEADLLDMIRISSPSKREGQMAKRLRATLEGLGVAVEEDDAGRQVGGEVGNLLAKFPGTAPNAPPLLLCAHMDTVVPCENVKPVVAGDVVKTDGTTVLGGDDKAGIAAILEALRVVRERRIPHGPVDVLFTICEEFGLVGAKHFDAARLRAKGYGAARQADACATPFGDDEFDVAVTYDVMHHVTDPAAMAREMVRIARTRVFLVEANGASLTRRLLELTNMYRQAGENSYLPRQYRRFFALPGVARVEIDPFQFVPPRALSPFAPLTIAISEALQHVPLLRWQCSGVRIRVTLDKPGPARR